MAKKQILPRLHVMVVCDAIEERSEETDLYDLKGVRTQFLSDAFPCTLELWVYLQLTGHEGTALAELKIVHPRTNQEIWVDSLPDLEFLGPQVVLCARGQIRNCSFPEPGLYFIQLFVEGKLIGEKMLKLLHI